MKKIIYILILSYTFLNAQTYDCIGATKICDSTYTLTTLPIDTSDLFNEINPFNSCLAQGEVKGSWYKFGFQSSGTLKFLITPMDTTVDFDWAVFKLDWRDCSEIFGNDSLLVSCSYAGIGGGHYVTGATGNSIQGQEPAISVVSPALYYLYITTSIYDTAATQGYTIDFTDTDVDFVTCTQIGIEEENTFYAHIYPNPTSDYFSIKSIEQIDSMHLFSSDGKMIQSTKDNKMNVSNLNQGIYYVEIISEHKKSVQKLFVIE